MLQGKKILITAGPTYEAIDPVRFISNHSTGKMGYAIAKECVRLGAEVILVSGPTQLPDIEGCKMNRVRSAADMFHKVDKHFPHIDVAILTAAVADYTPKTVSPTKIKKKGEDMTIELVKTVDIAKTLGEQKAHQLLVGFALETDHEEEHAIEKLNRKNLDFIVLNSLRNKGTCFGSDQNKITILEHQQKIEFDTKPKSEVAKDIVQHIISKLA